MKLVEKLSNAKKEIKESKLKKEGRNSFSNYDYFTPSQIEYLVQSVCQSNRILTKFDLTRDSLGVYGTLTIYDLDSNDTLVFTMATAIPEIKATNIAQQLGGCVTYTERYLKTSAFGITDNNLDFDSQDNRPKIDVDSRLLSCKTQGDLTKLFSEVNPKDAATIEKFTKRKLELNGK